MINFPNAIASGDPLSASVVSANNNAFVSYFTDGAGGASAIGLNAADFATLTGPLISNLQTGLVDAVTIIATGATSNAFVLTSSAQGDYAVELSGSGTSTTSILSTTVTSTLSANPAIRVVNVGTGGGSRGLELVNTTLQVTKLSPTAATVALVNVQGPVALPSSTTVWQRGGLGQSSGSLVLAQSATVLGPGKADEFTLTNTAPGPLRVKDLGIGYRHIGGRFFTASISNATYNATDVMCTISITNASANRRVLVGLRPTSGSASTLTGTATGAGSGFGTVLFNNSTASSSKSVRRAQTDSATAFRFAASSFVTELALANGSNSIVVSVNTGSNPIATSGVEAWAVLL